MATMTIAKTIDDADAAWKAATPEERAQIEADVSRGTSPIHAVNLVRSRRRQDAARNVDDPEATTGESFAVGLGNGATFGGIPTIAAALGHGEGDTFAERKAHNVEDLKDIQASSPLAATAGEVIGSAAPSAVGGIGALRAGGGAAARAGLAAAAKSGAKAGALYGGIAGAGSTDTGDVTDIALRTLGGAATGAVTGAATSVVPGVATRIAPSLAKTTVTEAARAPVSTLEDVLLEAMDKAHGSARPTAARALDAAALAAKPGALREAAAGKITSVADRLRAGPKSTVPIEPIAAPFSAGDVEPSGLDLARDVRPTKREPTVSGGRPVKILPPEFDIGEGIQSATPIKNQPAGGRPIKILAPIDDALPPAPTEEEINSFGSPDEWSTFATKTPAQRDPRPDLDEAAKVLATGTRADRPAAIPAPESSVRAEAVDRLAADKLPDLGQQARAQAGNAIRAGEVKTETRMSGEQIKNKVRKLLIQEPTLSKSPEKLARKLKISPAVARREINNALLGL